MEPAPLLLGYVWCFCKDNVPFKDKMCELLEKTIVIWWDPLHLINRAHIRARGKLCIDIVDLDDDNLSYDEEQTMEIQDECFVRTDRFYSE